MSLDIYIWNLSLSLLLYICTMSVLLSLWVVHTVAYIYSIPNLYCTPIVNHFISFVLGSCNYKWDKFLSLSMKVIICTCSYQINLCLGYSSDCFDHVTSVYNLISCTCWYCWYSFLILAFRVFHLLGSRVFPVLTALSCQIKLFIVL